MLRWIWEMLDDQFNNMPSSTSAAAAGQTSQNTAPVDSWPQHASQNLNWTHLIQQCQVAAWWVITWFWRNITRHKSAGLTTNVVTPAGASPVVWIQTVHITCCISFSDQPMTILFILSSTKPGDYDLCSWFREPRRTSSWMSPFSSLKAFCWSWNVLV